MFYDFITKYTDIFVEKMRAAFALQKLLTFFQQKIFAYLIYKVRNLNETLTNIVISFKQPGPDLRRALEKREYLVILEIILINSA